MRRERLLQKIEAFMRQNKMHATDFGKRALKDPNFVFRLRNGRDITLTTLDKLETFMLEYDENLSD